MLDNQVKSDFKFSEELVNKIKSQYKEEFNIILDDQQAQEYLHSYADLFDFVVKERLNRKV